MVDEGIQGNKLRAIKWGQKAQESMYISYITTASGRKVGSGYLSDWKESREAMCRKHMSLLSFRNKVLTPTDWML